MTERSGSGEDHSADANGAIKTSSEGSVGRDESSSSSAKRIVKISLTVQSSGLVAADSKQQSRKPCSFPHGMETVKN